MKLKESLKENSKTGPWFSIFLTTEIILNSWLAFSNYMHAAISYGVNIMDYKNLFPSLTSHISNYTIC